MHKLYREIRFSVNPFGAVSEAGFNTYASQPCGDGLSLYLSLGVELVGPVEASTGFVVNVSEIDRRVRGDVIPDFSVRIRGLYRRQHPTRFAELAGLLEAAAQTLAPQFPFACLSRLVLGLSPYRSLTFLPEDPSMLLYSEKFEFAAMHRLWNDRFSESENFERFGKCANPNGHGHNYVLEVSVEIEPQAERGGWTAGFERVVKEEFIDKVDHKNLNMDVTEFQTKNPTVENITQTAWDCLRDKFPTGRLRKVRVWENDRTCCTIEG